MRLGKKDDSAMIQEDKKVKEAAKLKLTFEEVVSGKDPVFQELLDKYNQEVKRAKHVRENLSKRSDEIKIAIHENKTKDNKDVDLSDVSKVLSHDSMLDPHQARKLKRLSKKSYANDKNVLVARYNILTYIKQYLEDYDKRNVAMYDELRKTMESNRKHEKELETRIEEHEQVFGKLSSRIDMQVCMSHYSPIREIEQRPKTKVLGGKTLSAIKLSLSILENSINK
ncbi:hypothetical protein J3A84_05295 [Proteiniclasticum sp. SCR006]|uniref:Uncharacterized protein n=1 Tax=Proteiniclasticum aestuarii TaxID=2817862 RepID=A0A939H7A7_9CLOT|nr:hypothetical protein [Proteiniclasticum aestuarii]MBO1264456.1 hypothetical protein [Proteiniclasticum aestuarii]